MVFIQCIMESKRKTLGESTGRRLSIKPDDSVYKPWLEWMKQEREDDFKKIMTQKEGVNGPPTGVKQQILGYIFRSCLKKLIMIMDIKVEFISVLSMKMEETF